jgi:hypothetical protein
MDKSGFLETYKNYPWFLKAPPVQRGIDPPGFEREDPSGSNKDGPSVS